METIIGVLVAVCILIFKVIEKKISDSAQPKPAQRKLEELFPILEEEEKNHFMTEEEFSEEETPSAIKVAEPFKETVAPTIEVMEETPKEKEKIDPKKLIVYSEIMNRKY